MKCQVFFCNFCKIFFAIIITVLKDAPRRSGTARPSIKKEGFSAFPLDGADQLPSTELGQPVDRRLIGVAGDGGLPEVYKFHFFISFLFLIVVYYNSGVLSSIFLFF